MPTGNRLARHLATAIAALTLMWFSASALAFDHTHSAWGDLLKKHVVLINQGNASQVRYGEIKANRPALKAYLDSLSSVSETDYGTWTKPQKLAFLINAYNAFTIELVLTRYPKLDSIKDIGSLFKSPWKQTFIPLLGQQYSLDDLEHGLIRAPGVFDDPRIHVAVVCASVGCPMLRNEAFTAERLDAQLEDAMRRFLSDRSRNRFDPVRGELQVSKIFDWYGKDFELGNAGFDSLSRMFAQYAEQIADSAEQRERIRKGDYQVEFLDYDWKLNDSRKNPS